MVDHLESGDRAAADADFAACEHLAERLGHYAFHVQLAWYRSMIAFVEGRLDDAEQLIARRVRAQPRIQRAGGVDRVRRADVPPAARAGPTRRARRDAPGRAPNASRTWRWRSTPASRRSPASTGAPTKRARLLDRVVAERPVRGRQRSDGHRCTPCTSPKRRSPSGTTRRRTPSPTSSTRTIGAGRAARHGPPLLRCDRSGARRRRSDPRPPRRGDRVLRACDRHRGVDRRADLRQPLPARARRRARRARRATATASGSSSSPRPSAGRRGARHADGRRRRPGPPRLSHQSPALVAQS